MFKVKKGGELIEFKSICIIDLDGDKIWYNDKGERHRENGPACEFNDGYSAWYIHDKPHREDGPAVEFEDGSKSWYLNGKQLTELEFVQKQMSETLSKFGYKFDIKDGNIVLIKE